MMRTPSTIIYKRGEVVLLPFPYTDHSGFKRRPAVILSTDAYNMRRDDLIVAPITSNVGGRQPDDILLRDWAAAGLVKPSVVKGILGSIEQSLVLRKMRTLSASSLPYRKNVNALSSADLPTQFSAIHLAGLPMSDEISFAKTHNAKR